MIKMKKMRAIFISTIVLIVTFVGTSLAANHIRLIVNEREITPKTPLQIAKGEPVGSIKDISKALGADVQWDKTKQIIKVTDTKKQLLERKEQLLENAFTLDTPDEIANNWARGVMSRNGALQYALLCDELKKKMLPDFISFQWVTGVSSPWIDKFEIVDKEKAENNIWKYTIKFHYTDSTKSSMYSTSIISVGKNRIEQTPTPLPIYPPVVEDKWCIVEIISKQTHATNVEH
jgi:hypothetical protein